MRCRRARQAPAAAQRASSLLRDGIDERWLVPLHALDGALQRATDIPWTMHRGLSVHRAWRWIVMPLRRSYAILERSRSKKQVLRPRSAAHPGATDSPLCMVQGISV